MNGNLKLPAMLLCLALLAGCNGRTGEDVRLTAGKPAEGQEAPAAGPEEEVFAELSRLGWFDYSIGIGGWSTTLTIGEDGTFTGLYHGADWGETGLDYPQGTVYSCAFHGKFTQPEPLADGSYSLRLETLEIEGAPEITYGDEKRYVAVESPRGLEQVEELLLFFPGFPAARLPEEFCAGWVREELAGETELPFYALYNVEEQAVFVAYPREETEYGQA